MFSRLCCMGWKWSYLDRSTWTCSISSISTTLNTLSLRHYCRSGKIYSLGDSSSWGHGSPAYTETFFGNISRLPDSSIKKQLALRQLAVKLMNSHSWFLAVKKFCVMYGLMDCADILENAQMRVAWRSTVQKAVSQYWSDRLQAVVALYSSLRWLDSIWIILHWLKWEVPRISVHMKTVSYMHTSDK